MRRKHWPQRSGLGLGLGLGGSGGSYILNSFSYSKEDYADFVTSLTATGCTVEDLGLSADGGSHIYGIKTGNFANPTILIQGVIHGGEWQFAYPIRRFMTFLADPSTAGAAAPYFYLLKENFSFYAVPIANPWGYINNTQANSNGINLNRNFPFTYNGVDYWTAYAGGDKGAAAGDQAETVISMNNVTSLLPILYLDCHLEGTNDYKVFCTTIQNQNYWTSVNTRLNNIGFTSTFYSENSFFPYGHNWARTVLNTNQHRMVNVCAFDIGTANSTANIGHYGINALMQSCMEAIDWKDSQYEEEMILVYPNSEASDTYINSFVPDNNFGVFTSMWVGQISAGIRRGFINYPLSLLPSNANVDSAILRSYCVDNGNNNNPNTITIHKCLTQWWAGLKSNAAPDPGQDGSTWNHRNANGAVAWGAAGGQSGVDYAAAAVASTVVTTKLVYYSWDLTDAVQDVVDGEAYLGWFVKASDEATNGLAKSFSPAEDTGAATKPKLIVTLK